MSILQEDLVRSLDALSVVQLDQLVDGFTQRLGLPRPQVIQAPVLIGISPPAVVVPDSFAVVVVGVTDKIRLIKAVRELSSLGLKEAKDVADRPVPFVFRDELSHDEAKAIAAKLTEVGARVELKP